MAGRPRKLPQGPKTWVQALVDLNFHKLCVAAARVSHRGNVSDWLRDVVAEQLGFDSFSHYRQSVSRGENSASGD